MLQARWILLGVLTGAGVGMTGCQPAQTSSESGGSSGAAAMAAKGPYDKPGFQTQSEEGRLWVFRAGEKMEKSDKHITLVGSGPAGKTIKAPDRQTAIEYIIAKPGFKAELEDGRVWVFRDGQKAEKSDKHISLIGAGPLGMTVKAPDRPTALEYIASKPGFQVQVDEENRLWVFRAGEKMEKSDKHISLIGAGPLGMTVKAPDRETALAYLAAKAGFTVEIDAGRLWVFSAEEKREKSEKHVTRVGAGPLGATVRANDPATLDLYLR